MEPSQNAETCRLNISIKCNTYFKNEKTSQKLGAKPTLNANCPELIDIPHEYMRAMTWLTASTCRTLSPVIGHVPLFARVAAITALLSQVISRDEIWQRQTLNYCSQIITKCLFWMLIRCLWGKSKLAVLCECYLEIEFQDLLYVRSWWKAAVFSHEVSQCKVSEMVSSLIVSIRN